ncbi:MAG: hypothetical protein RI514_08690, partial [Spiribacter sp.]|nr:hypothetical protein [Spiribacter sp.]
QGLRQAAERQSQDDDDSDRSRDVRPGRGSETGTTQPIDDGGSSGSSSSGGGGSSGGGSSGGGGSSSGGSSGGDSDRSVDRRPGRGTEDRTEAIDDDGGGSSAGDADRSDGDADMQQDKQQDDAPPSGDGGGRRPGDRGDPDPRLEPTEEEAQTLEDIEERAGGGVLSPGQEQFLRDLSDRVTGPAAAAVTS